ncbi:integrase-like protein [Mucilaginibacter gracilis]|uniref:Integrase-like protein n=1 Tax=Mucilaginibacter gracilis TaxID=423350 RepID=A0A495J3Z0_9SPHI|nr:site-specific integrase [Mucilaginibacter gracilis]RKR83312.1 integrase-like protein [Mucilaginibacter gracilis]
MPIFKYAVKFVLQQVKDKKKPTPLRCFVRYNNTRCVFKSGVVIEPQYWLVEPQKPRQVSAIDYKSIDSGLESVKNCVKTAFDYLSDKNKEYPDPDKLKDLVSLIMKNNGDNPYIEKPAKNYTLFEFIEKLIRDTKEGKRVLGSGNRYSPGTIKAYGSAFGVLKGYHDYKVSKITRGKAIEPIRFEDIDLNFYEDFKDWCYLYRSETLSDNYFGTVIKFIKTVMSESLEQGLHANTKYKSKNFVKVKTEVDNIFLNKDQLEKFAAHDFSKNKKLERVRDLFLVGCWTGLRFSDFTNISPKDIADGFFEIKTQKTKTDVVIPIFPVVLDIMTRYQGITPNSLPPTLSNVKLNEYIKEAAKEAGFTEIVTLEKSMAGRKVKITEPLYKLITTHSARRSFASNMYHIGMSTNVIMAVTGHKSQTAFNTYVKVKPKEKGEMMKKEWDRLNMKVVNE